MEVKEGKKVKWPARSDFGLPRRESREGGRGATTNVDEAGR